MLQDLDYELRRQSSGSGNAYVGLRLAKGTTQEDVNSESPRKPNDDTTLDLLTLQVLQFYTHLHEIM